MPYSTSTIPLSCTVRGCARALQRGATAWACDAGHTFDVARSGYVNLLQPQDRRAASPGDDRATVEARTVLAAAGIGRSVVDAIGSLASALSCPRPATVVDLGSGTGELLAAVGSALDSTTIGIDISTFAADTAARRSRDHIWLVANADRRLPLQDHAVDLVLSLHARRNPEECARVLRPTGRLIVAVPAIDDLIELRTAVHGRALDVDRAASVIAEHESRFRVVDRATVRARHHLNGELLPALLRVSYRGGRRSEQVRASELRTLDVTLASDVLVFAPAAT